MKSTKRGIRALTRNSTSRKNQADRLLTIRQPADMH